MEIKEILIEKIKLDKNQPRKTFDEDKLKEMSETFKTQGTIQPIEIDENNIIITGELRYRASKMAGLKTIPCKILKGLTPELKLERQLVENFNRQDMRLVDSIEAVKRYMKSLSSTLQRNINNDEFIKTTSERLGISRQWLSQNLKLDREAPPELKKAVKEGKISVSVATEIMKAPKEELKELTETAIELQSSAVVGANSIRERVQEKKTLRELKEKQEELKKTKEFEIRIRRTEEAFDMLKTKIDNQTRELQKMIVMIRGVRRIKKFYFAKPKEKENFFKFLDGTIDKFEYYLKELRELKENIELEVIRE